MNLTLHGTATTPEQGHTFGIRVAAVCILCILCVVGSVGHSFLIFTLYKTQHYRYQCRMFIINMSVVSLLCNALSVPLYLANLIAGRQYYSDAFCSVLAYFGSFLFVALLANCLMIAVERCVVLTGPMGPSNKRKTWILLALLWVIPLVLALCGVPFFGFNDNQLHCIYEEHTERTWYSIVLIAVPTTVTLGAICTCYILIFKKVSYTRRQVQQFRHSSSNHMLSPSPKLRRLSTSVPNLREVRGSMAMLGDLKQASFSQSMSSLRERIAAWSDSHERELRLTVQLMVNFTLFILLWLPLTTLYFMEGFVYVSPDIWLCFSMLARVFAAINWAMYGLWSKPIRNSCLGFFSRFFICCCRSYANKRSNRVISIRIIQEELKKDLDPRTRPRGSCIISRPVSEVPNVMDRPRSEIRLFVTKHSMNGDAITPVEQANI